MNSYTAQCVPYIEGPRQTHHFHAVLTNSSLVSNPLTRFRSSRFASLMNPGHIKTIHPRITLSSQPFPALQPSPAYSELTMISRSGSRVLVRLSVWRWDGLTRRRAYISLMEGWARKRKWRDEKKQRAIPRKDKISNDKPDLNSLPMHESIIGSGTCLDSEH